MHQLLLHASIASLVTVDTCIHMHACMGKVSHGLQACIIQNLHALAKILLSFWSVFFVSVYFCSTHPPPQTEPNLSLPSSLTYPFFCIPAAAPSASLGAHYSSCQEKHGNLSNPAVRDRQQYYSVTPVIM